ncbi:LysM peptidoglycan-binding domain-containing protein [Microlunatus sp. Y2014]|uniref:LysM peptidoglycan-binding domain-containing protein n=1 Tax=Microlunatus sp. Y2014 TaxID=3418488 RepID=UPI003DA6D66A
MRVVRGLAAMLVLLVVVLGTPVLLSVIGVGIDPARWQGRGLLDILLSPDDGSLLLALLTGIGWIAWLLFTGCVVVELVNQVSRGTKAISLPGLRAPQAVAAGLVLTTLSLVISPVRPATAPADAPAADAPPTAAVVRVQHGPVSGGLPAPDGPALSADGPARADDVADVRGVLAVHTVENGDDLWSLADHYYADGGRWRVIATANAVLLHHGPDDLVPGWRLVIPVPGVLEPGRWVVVADGDTLSGLAASHLGDGDRWPELYEVNRAVLADPDVLATGTALRLPDGSAATTVPLVAAPLPPLGVTTTAGQGETTPPGNTSTGAPSYAGVAGTAEATGEVDPSLLVPGVGGMLAAAMVGGLVTRRMWQLQQRPVGRRIAHPGPAAVRVERALGRQQAPVNLSAVDRAMRLLAGHCRGTGSPLPRVLSARIDGRSLEWQVAAGRTDAPEPFRVAGRVWTIDDVPGWLATPDPYPDEVRPWPALTVVGSDAEAQVMVNLEEVGVLDVAADRDAEAGRGRVAAVLTALAMEVAYARWSGGVRLTVVGSDDPTTRWVSADDHPTMRLVGDPDLVLDAVERRVSAQRAALGTAGDWFGDRRLDPDLHDSWTAEVLVFREPLSGPQQDRLARLLVDGPAVSVAAVTAGGGTGRMRFAVGGRTATLTPGGLTVVPQTVAADTAADVAELFGRTTAPDTPAPWWTPEPRLPGGPSLTVPPAEPSPTGPPARPDDKVTDSGPRVVEEVAPVEQHPMALLLGPIELTGARGKEPARARRQCIEYAAWLLEHPGSTAAAMASGLIVAEGTRRSNMSRLRTWLGDGDDGPYLPDAYSGRITLHESVTSDWQELSFLVAPGVNRASSSALTAALDLVRGTPLADAAPGEWPWAEELRTDMASVVRDIGVELTERALADGDVDLARWAASRALTACQGDEALLAARIRTEHRAGNTVQVRRLCREVTGQARRLGLDLDDETVVLLQQVLEGTTRTPGRAQ